MPVARADDDSELTRAQPGEANRRAANQQPQPRDNRLVRQSATTVPLPRILLPMVIHEIYINADCLELRRVDLLFRIPSILPDHVCSSSWRPISIGRDFQVPLPHQASRSI
jgi:hypothetical protein